MDDKTPLLPLPNQFRGIKAVTSVRADRKPVEVYVLVGTGPCRVLQYARPHDTRGRLHNHVAFSLARRLTQLHPAEGSRASTSRYARRSDHDR